MKVLTKLIRLLDKMVNVIAILGFSLMILYGIYAVWDSMQIYKGADMASYETYRPGEKGMSFEELRKINPEVFGWLTVAGTNIDYPLVQGEDNSKYVNTDAKGEFSLSGSIFLDFRSDRHFKDMNHILYGHHMDKNVMFGELKNFSDETYFKEHLSGEIYYDDSWHNIVFFAFLETDAYDPVLYNAKLNGEEDFQTFLNAIKERAVQFRDIECQAKDRFVLLSTCTSASTNGRQILAGKIVEQPNQEKESEERRWSD